MEDGTLESGRRQSFYYPDTHPQYPGWFEEMADLLRERGLADIANKRFECPPFKKRAGLTVAVGVHYSANQTSKHVIASCKRWRESSGAR